MSMRAGQQLKRNKFYCQLIGKKMNSSSWLFALFFMATPMIATANETLVFFDLEKCTSGTVENEPLTGNKTYESWVKMAAELKENSQWEVFYTSETKIGICRTVFTNEKSEIYCR